MRMNILARLSLIGLALTALWLPSIMPARGDIGPRPPIRTIEVKDPENYLVMKSETVDVTIDGHVARVTATFHFEGPDHYRETLAMRLGFPEMKADRPLKNFQVQQRIYVRNHPSSKWTSISNFEPQPAGTGPSKSLAASWKTWPVVLQGHEGAPTLEDVEVRVTYDQELTPVSGKWRYTYVLRSGAPWKNPIGKAEIKVAVKKGALVSASPAGATTGATGLGWILQNFEPTQDVVVVVK